MADTNTKGSSEQSTISTSIQLVDCVTPVLNTITSALIYTISNFTTLQNITSKGINIGNIQTTIQGFADIGEAICSIDELFLQTRANMESPIQPSVIYPNVASNSVQMPYTSSQTSSNIPTSAFEWMGSSNIDIFNNSGIERFNQELASAQNMASRLASTQAGIAINSANTRIFPPNMNRDMENTYRRVLRISQEITRLSHQPVSPANANQLNNSIETLRRHLNSAISEQNTLNSAIQAMDLNAANAAYQRLVNNIDSAEVHIRDNINSQNNFNNSINQGAANASNLMNRIKSIAGAYLGLRGLEKGIESTTGAAMQLARQMQTLNTMFGNEAVGTAYFKQLQQYALDTGQDIANLTAATRRYIGYTKNTEKLMNFNKIAQKMAVYDPVQGVQGAAFALNEALSGSYTSLKLRFELSSADITPLKEAVKSGSIDEFQAAMTSIMDKKNITDEVLESFQNTAASKFEKLINSFKSKLAEAGQASIQVVEPMINKINTWLDSSGGASMINGISNAAFTLMNILDIVITQAMSIGDFISNNWSMISPIIWTVVGAIVAYNAALAVCNTLSTISNTLSIAKALYSAIKTHATIAETAATVTATGAQIGLNTAMLACPVMWIVLAIVALVAILFAAVVAIAKFRNENVSAVGVVAGVFFALGSCIYNVIAFIYNRWAAFVEFFVNVWHHPIYSIKKLFVNFGNNVLDIVKNIAEAIDFVFGSNLAGAVSSLQGKLTAWVGEMPEGYKVIKRMENKSLADSYNKGYDWAAGLADKFKMPSADNIEGVEPVNLDDWNAMQADNLLPIADNTGGTKANTDGLKDTFEDSIEYLRDLAERETINRFTTAEIKLTMNNSNNISSDLDLDGIVSNLTDKLYEQMQVAAEGVYN